MLGTDFVNNFIFVPLVGASGGILIAWREQIGAIGATRIDAFSALIQLCPESGDPWWLTCAYGPQSNSEKISFLQELRDVRNKYTEL
jgi:hypothetical protein